MRALVNWQDHVVEKQNIYKKTENADGTITLVKDTGAIIQQGTPMNATNFNIMDMAALEALFITNENSRMLLMTRNALDGITGTKIQVTLTNTQTYPHNNSKKTAQLTASRNNMDYTIEAEIVSTVGGAVGDIEYSDKLLNGFKVAFTGSASSVVLNLYVRGGI